MTEATPQPLAAGDPEAVPTKEDAIQEAASAFKVALGQEEAPEEQPRGPDGKFVSTKEPQGEDTALEVQEGGDEAGEDGGEIEAAEEAQPEEPSMPASWAKDKAEIWESLPPEAQGYIAAREGERDRAVNSKFQEAANVLKANEAVVIEANANRAIYAQAVDQVLSLVRPQAPPISMLDINSVDYDPDQYHYQKAQAEQVTAFLTQHAQQRHLAAAQEQLQTVNAINAVSRDKFIESVPDAADQAKAPAVFQGLIEYAVENGAPIQLFQTPTSALEWHVLWKAREYDRLQTAKAKVQTDPKPEPRKPQPAVRPGVTTPRSAIEKQRLGRAQDRLAREGSVEAGAAVLKQLMKGSIR